MEPEDKSRHSKAKPEPVTIDLGAEEVKEMPAADSDGVKDNATAKPATEAAQDAAAVKAKAAESKSADVGKATFGRTPNVSADTAKTDTGKTDTGKTESASHASSGIPNASMPPRPEPVARQKQSDPSLILTVAALLGGVIALIGASGLQYWGVLPSLGSNDKTEATLNLMSQEIATLKKDLAAQATPQVDLSPVETKLAALEERVAKVPEANGLSADADARISALSEQVRATETAASTLKSEADTARAALLMRIEAIETKLDQPRDDVEVAVAIASAGLKAAIDRGGPFTAELATLQGIKPDDAAVKELATFAGAGVPSRAKLIADFPVVADTILAASQSDDPNQGFADRLLSSAFSSIQVRPVGEVEGEGPEAIVARMETRLTNGDFKSAAGEWDKLPEPAKKASEAYKKSLDARIRVEELVGSALSKAVSATKQDG